MLRSLEKFYLKNYPNCLPLHEKLLFPPEPVVRPGIETLCSKSFYEAYEMAINFLKSTRSFHWSKEKTWGLLMQLHEAAENHVDSAQEDSDVITRIRGVCFADGLKKSFEKNYQIVMKKENVTHLNNPDTMREDRLKALKETVKQLMKIEGKEADEENEINTGGQDELNVDENGGKISGKTEQEDSMKQDNINEIVDLDQLPNVIEQIVDIPVEKMIQKEIPLKEIEKEEIILSPKETVGEREIKYEEPIEMDIETKDLNKDSTDIDSITEDIDHDVEFINEVPVEDLGNDEILKDETFTKGDESEDNFKEDQTKFEEKENVPIQEKDEGKEELVDIIQDTDTKYVTEKVIKEGDLEEEEPLDSDKEELSQAEKIDSDDSRKVNEVVLDAEGEMSIGDISEDDQEDSQNLEPKFEST